MTAKPGQTDYLNTETDEEGWSESEKESEVEEGDGEMGLGRGDFDLAGSQGNGYAPWPDSSTSSELLSDMLFNREAAFREAAYEND